MTKQKVKKILLKEYHLSPDAFGPMPLLTLFHPAKGNATVMYSFDLRDIVKKDRPLFKKMKKLVELDDNYDVHITGKVKYIPDKEYPKLYRHIKDIEIEEVLLIPRPPEECGKVIDYYGHEERARK